MASLPTAQLEETALLATPEQHHAGKIAEIQTFLTRPTERGQISSSSLVDRKGPFPIYEEPVEVSRAMNDMARAIRALQESATFRKLSEIDFEAVVDINVARQHLGEGTENAVFMGRDLGPNGYELTFRMAERTRRVDGSFLESGWNWGNTKVTLKSDSVEVKTQANEHCVWV